MTCALHWSQTWLWPLGPVGLKVWSRLALPLGKLNVQMFRSSYKDFGVFEEKQSFLGFCRG